MLPSFIRMRVRGRGGGISVWRPVERRADERSGELVRVLGLWRWMLVLVGACDSSSRERAAPPDTTAEHLRSDPRWLPPWARLGLTKLNNLSFPSPLNVAIVPSTNRPPHPEGHQRQGHRAPMPRGSSAEHMRAAVISVGRAGCIRSNIMQALAQCVRSRLLLHAGTRRTQTRNGRFAAVPSAVPTYLPTYQPTCV